MYIRNEMNVFPFSNFYLSPGYSGPLIFTFIRLYTNIASVLQFVLLFYFYYVHVSTCMSKVVAKQS